MSLYKLKRRAVVKEVSQTQANKLSTNLLTFDICQPPRSSKTQFSQHVNGVVSACKNRKDVGADAIPGNVACLGSFLAGSIWTG